MLLNKGSNIIEVEYTNLYKYVDYKISIPIFQRFYSWKENQIKELLCDIEGCLYDEEKEIYLLDFIYYSEDGFIKLADGQQRLVSLNLLIKAIIDYSKEHSIEIDEISLFDISYDNFAYNKKYKDCFENYVVAPFKKMYILLYDFVKEHSDVINDFIFIIKNKIYIFMKKTPSADAAFTIFTQINTGGKPLSKDEVIKTTIDQYSSLYEVEITSGIKQLKKAIASFYKFVNSSDGSNFDSIAIMSFLKNYIVINKQEFIKFSKYLNLISSISKYSIYYIIDYINRSQLFDILYIMALKNIDVNKERTYLTDIMFPLCLLSVVMTMKKSNPGGIIKSLYANVIDQIKGGKSSQEISVSIASFINDNSNLCKISFLDFAESLGKKELSTKIKEALLIIDVVLHTTSSDLNVECINLEHIYPRNPAYQWAMNGWPTNKELRSVYINNIGNFLLLNESVNKKIKNKYIDEKIVEYNRIIPRDISLITPMNTVNFDKFKNEKYEYIESRKLYIAESIYENFPLAKVIISK